MTNLKRIIDEKGVQQRWLAEQVGVTEVSMSRYVSGDRIPKAPLAIRMADVLGVDVKELYRWEPEERTRERTETHACDCISRQAAIDAVAEGLKRVFVEYLDVAEKMINKLPSALPQRTGRWEIYVISMLDGEGCKCSECGFEGVPYWDFCPNCGARMEGEG